jgi:hypothetical protein
MTTSSTTPFISFARALSPTTQRPNDATVSPEEANRVARHTLLLGAESVDQLLALIPVDYRADLRDLILEVASTTTKWLNARATLAKWQAIPAGQYPSIMTSRQPEIQLSKDYRADAAGSNHVEAIAKEWKEWADATFTNLKKAKDDEVSFHEVKLNHERLFPVMRKAIDARYAVLKEQMTGLPTITKVPHPTELNQTVEVIEYHLSPATPLIYAQVKEDCLAYCARARSIVEAREAAVRRKNEAKTKLSKAADVEMKDATGLSSASLQSTIDKLTNAKLNNFLKNMKVSAFDLLPNILSDHSSIELAIEQEECRKERGAKGPKATRPLFASSSRQEASPYHRSQAERQSSASWQRREGKGRYQQQEARRIGLWEQGEEEELIAAIASSSEDSQFRYDVPSSYPDWLLTIPYPRAVSYVLLNTPIDIVSAAQFKSYVHLSPGVNVPIEIQHQLSVGLRYMFATPRNEALIGEAWSDFERRLRWRLKFAFANEEGEYDPDYEVEKPVKAKAPLLPSYIEYGLKRGQLFVKEAIANARLQPAESAFYKPLTPSAKDIRKFLLARNYVVTATDKNLGVAVSESTWINEKCMDLLADRDNYQPVWEWSAMDLCHRTCEKMERIARMTVGVPFEKQLKDFFRSKITRQSEDGKSYLEKHCVPVFYGIPKIHKVPTKMRPIIPCHSAIQNPAAKYVSKNLKPLLAATPTVLRGSKDLAVKLSQLTMSKTRKSFILTGDVVAMYPNTPLDLCIERTLELWMEYKGWDINDKSKNTAEEEAQADLFSACLQVGNRNLICKYGDKYYLQKKGLAMGVADSPDLANLHCWYDERRLRIQESPNVAFYARFIDDCLAILYADSAEEALAWAERNIVFEGLQIEWNVSDQYAHFLDMTLYKDRDLSIQWMPYRKARNHMERIPWISAHPLDVRRGTFLGEMSRLATLSSKFDTYKDAIKGLAALYIARGYPSREVDKWLKDNIASKWQNRLTVRKSEETSGTTQGVLVLKTEFNTTWNYFSARELGDTIFSTWREYCDRADPLTNGNAPPANPNFDAHRGNLDVVDPALDTEFMTAEGLYMLPDVRKLDVMSRRMIVSRKRTRNLFDLTSFWKKTVLKHMEEDAQSVQGVPLPDETTQNDMEVDSPTSGPVRDRSPPAVDPQFFLDQASSISHRTTDTRSRATRQTTLDQFFR